MPSVTFTYPLAQAVTVIVLPKIVAVPAFAVNPTVVYPVQGAHVVPSNAYPSKQAVPVMSI